MKLEGQVIVLKTLSGWLPLSEVQFELIKIVVTVVIIPGKIVCAVRITI